MQILLFYLKHFCKKSWKCLHVPQCVDAAFFGKYRKMKCSSSPRPLFYLKARGGVSWNSALIDRLNQTAFARGYRDVLRFVYGYYDRDAFLSALLCAPWAVGYSPWETYGWWHIEARALGVPLFILEPLSVLFFTNRSGIVVDADAVRMELVVKEFEKFLGKLSSFRPLDDLEIHGLLPPKCGSNLQNITF